MGRLNRHIEKAGFLGFLMLVFWPIGCIDPFVIETNDLEQILVVEATLTNELIHQQIKLSRTIGLEDFGQAIERDASVKVEDSQGNSYEFSFDDQIGYYLSNEKFCAKANTTYTLRILTQDGRSYFSDDVALTPKAQMDKVYPAMNPEMGAGTVQVLVDVENAGKAQYFRYEYEETYRVVLPHPSPFRWKILDYSPFTRTFRIELLPRRLDLSCYVTNHSSGIKQTSIANLNELRISRFPVHAIDVADPVIKERYSILVKQYVQSLEAYTFYKTLSDLGTVESLLSQGQPGFVPGNITSENDPNEKILGFFEVASYSEQRIYFNYTDFDLELPPYFEECDHLISYEIGSDLLKRKLEFEKYQVFFFEERPVNGSAPQKIYHISQSVCTDCPLNSSHVKPDFWKD